MLVVITGASSGVGLACVNKFITEGYDVIGLDSEESAIRNDMYSHIKCNISNELALPNIQLPSILINSANVQNSGRDIDINLVGTINCTKKYGLHHNIKSVINVSDAAAHQGTNFPEYVASKGGVNAFTKWTAKQIAQYGATCNSISFGGILTEINSPVIDNNGLWNKIMELTPLKRWATTAEAAEWIYFLSVINRSCSGQDIVIDNLESLNGQFIWE